MTALSAASSLQSFANGTTDAKARTKVHAASGQLQKSDPSHAAVYRDLENITTTHLTAAEALVDVTVKHGLSDAAADTLLSSLLTTAQGAQV